MLIILGFHRIIEHFLDTDDITVMFSDKYAILQTYLTNSSLEPLDERPFLSQLLHTKVCTVEWGVLYSQVYRLIEVKDQ